MSTERGEEGRRSYLFSTYLCRVRQAKGLIRTRLLLVATSIVALVSMALMSCDSSRVTRPLPVEKPTALVLSTPETRETVNMEFPDPCTGELVQGTLETRQVADFSDQTPHQTVHMRFRFTGNGLKVVGFDMLGNPVKELTGTTYKGSGEHNEEVNVNLNADKFEWTTNDEFRIFATNYLSEAMDDFTMHANFHITLFIVPPRATSQVDNFSTDCK